jgi:hypothetical protein
MWLVEPPLLVIEEFTALRRTPPAAALAIRYPYLSNAPRLGYPLQCHRNPNSGHSSVDAAAGVLRRRAANSSSVLLPDEGSHSCPDHSTFIYIILENNP